MIVEKEKINTLLEEVPRYQYSKDGGCFFVIDDIPFEVMHLVNMRHPRTGFDTDAQIRITDIAIPVIFHKDSDEDDYTPMHTLYRDCWLYGATSNDFDEHKPVDKTFIDAAKAYIKEKGKDFLIKHLENV